MQNKKEKVLEAVLDTVLETGGISGVTVSEIAKRAGIGKGSVYMYFASKDQMIFEAAKYIVESTMADITDFETHADKSFRENMLGFLREHINVMQKYSSIFYALTASNFMPQFTPGLKEKMVGVIGKIRTAYHVKLLALMETGAAEGLVSREHTPFEILTTAQMLFSAAGHFAQKEVPVVSSDMDEYVAMMYDMAIKMLN